MKTKSLFLVTCLLGGLLCTSLPLFAQSADDTQEVTGVEVKGNQTVATATILSQVRTQAGRPLSSTLLSEDLKRLYGLGFFKDVRIEQDRSGGGLIVVFIVIEKPVLKQIEITGNKDIATDKINKKITTTVGSYVDEQNIRPAVD